MAKSKLGRAGGNEAGHIIAAGVMTGTNVLGPFVLDIREIDSISFDTNWTGTPTGSFKIEVSNSHLPNLNQGATGTPIRVGRWTDVTASFLPAIVNPAGSGSGGYTSAVLTTPCMAGKYLRFSYTNASGSGTLDVWVNGKSVGP